MEPLGSNVFSRVRVNQFQQIDCESLKKLAAVFLSLGVQIWKQECHPCCHEQQCVERGRFGIFVRPDSELSWTKTRDQRRGSRHYEVLGGFQEFAVAVALG